MKTSLKKPQWFTAITTLCLVAVTLFAVVSCDKPEHENKQYTLNFAGEEIDIEPQLIEYGKHATAPENPERESYDFGGWFIDNGTFANEWDFETDIVTQDTTLYAKWELIETCNFNNPLIDLPWLKEIVEGFKTDIEVGQLHHVRIYQCNYIGGTGFLLELCVGCPDFGYTLMSCEGESLCILWGFTGSSCSELNVDFEHKKLIWEIQPTPPLTIDNLYEQPLCVIKKYVLGKWRLHKMWDGTGHYYSNTFVDISENMVIASGNDVNYTFSYSWKQMEVYPPYPNMSSYTTFVMWNDEQNKGEWSFYNLRDDFLEVNLYGRPGVYTLIRIRE